MFSGFLLAAFYEGSKAGRCARCTWAEHVSTLEYETTENQIELPDNRSRFRNFPGGPDWRRGRAA